MFFTEVQDVSASVAARKGCVLELRVRVAQEQALCLSPPDERPTTSGRLAQLGERCVRNAEVGSSILLPSTNLRSPAFMRELRLASHPSCLIGWRSTLAERFIRPDGGCPP